MQKYFVLIFYCTFHEILLLLIVEGGAIDFDALHQLLYLLFIEIGYIDCQQYFGYYHYFIVILNKFLESEFYCFIVTP